MEKTIKQKSQQKEKKDGKQGQKRSESGDKRTVQSDKKVSISETKRETVHRINDTAGKSETSIFKRRIQLRQ